jgi:Bacterial Ig-like domain
MILRILFSIYILVFISSCANIQSLSGGARDTSAPSIDSIHSTPNMLTHFDKKEIILTFDEFLNLDNPYQNIIISPPLKEKPEITLKGKSILIKFSDADTFKVNTTYAINFGESIKDLHEGNIAKNMKYVFSTGDKIDSLYIKAKLTDAKTNAPIANGLMMLYDKNEDSIVAKSLPFYFAKSDKDGNVEITNIHEGKYKLFVLQDGNANYLYDNEKEQIAYPDSLIDISKNIDSLKFQLFAAEPDYIILDKDLAKGYIGVLYNKKPENINIKIEPKLNFTRYIDRDTLKILYTKNDTNICNLILTDFENNKDTIEIPKIIKKSIVDSFRLVNLLTNSTFNTINQFRDPALKFNIPIQNVNASLINVVIDSTKNANWKWQIDSSDLRILHILGTIEQDKTYNITLLPKAITSFQNIQNDTLNVNVTTLNTKTLGNIKLKIMDLESNKNYIVQIVSDANGVIYTKRIKNLTNFEAIIEGLTAEIYDLKIIEDINNNGILDAGNYWKHRKSEKVFGKKLEQLRANWDLEVEYSLKENKL